MKITQENPAKNAWITQAIYKKTKTIFSVEYSEEKEWIIRGENQEDEEDFVNMPIAILLLQMPHLASLPNFEETQIYIYENKEWVLEEDEEYDEDEEDDEDDVDEFEENDNINFDAPFDTSSLHPEVITYINEKAAQGFYNHREIFEDLEDIFVDDEDVDSDGDFDVDDYRDYCRYAIVQKMKTQKQWQAPTTWDKLAQVFDNLCQNKIIALHNAGNTISEGEQEIYETFSIINEDDKTFTPIGYCFYHWQDVDLVSEDGDLCLAFGNIEVTSLEDAEYEYNNNKEASIKIGQQIVNELKQYGFKVDWGNVIEKRIRITNLNWQKKTRELENLSDRAIKYLTYPKPEKALQYIDYDNAVWAMLPKSILPDWSGIYSIQSVETGNAQEAEDFMNEQQAHYGLACNACGKNDLINKINIYGYDGLVWGEVIPELSYRKLDKGFLFAQVECTDDEDICDQLILNLKPEELKWEEATTLNAIADDYIVFNAVHRGMDVVDNLEDEYDDYPQIEITLENKTYQVLTTIYKDKKSQTEMYLFWIK